MAGNAPSVPNHQTCKKSLLSFPCFHKLQNMETKAALLALAALSQDSRLRVFRTLVQAGPKGLAAGRIAEQTAIPPSSLSFHLKELAHADLVASHQSGRFVIYTARFSTMNDLIGYLTENCCGGNPCGPVGAHCANHPQSSLEEDTTP